MFSRVFLGFAFVFSGGGELGRDWMSLALCCSVFYCWIFVGWILNPIWFFLNFQEWRLKVEYCEGNLFANLQSSGGGSVIKFFLKKINVVGLKIEDWRLAPSQTISDMWLVPFQGIDGSASLRPSEHWDPSNGIHPPGSPGGSVVATWLDSRIFLNLVFCIEKHLFTDKCCSMWLGRGLKIGQKSSLAIFNLQSSIQPR